MVFTLLFRQGTVYKNMSELESIKFISELIQGQNNLDIDLSDQRYDRLYGFWQDQEYKNHIPNEEDIELALYLGYDAYLVSALDYLWNTNAMRSSVMEILINHHYHEVVQEYLPISLSIHLYEDLDSDPQFIEQAAKYVNRTVASIKKYRSHKRLLKRQKLLINILIDNDVIINYKNYEFYFNGSGNTYFLFRTIFIPTEDVKITKHYNHEGKIFAYSEMFNHGYVEIYENFNDNDAKIIFHQPCVSELSPGEFVSKLLEDHMNFVKMNMFIKEFDCHRDNKKAVKRGNIIYIQDEHLTVVLLDQDGKPYMISSPFSQVSTLEHYVWNKADEYVSIKGIDEKIRNHGELLVYKNGKIHNRFNYSHGEIDGLCYSANEGYISYKQGQKHGLCMGIYNDKFIISNYYYDQLHGPVKKYTLSGLLIYRATYHFNKLHGSCIAWHLNGNIKYIGHYNQGKKVKEEYILYENGKLSSLTQYDDDGHLHGIQRLFSHNGDVITAVFEQGDHRSISVSNSYVCEMITKQLKNIVAYRP